MNTELREITNDTTIEQRLRERLAEYRAEILDTQAYIDRCNSRLRETDSQYWAVKISHECNRLATAQIIACELEYILGERSRVVKL